MIARVQVMSFCNARAAGLAVRLEEDGQRLALPSMSTSPPTGSCRRR